MQKRLNLWQRLKPECKENFNKEYKEKSYLRQSAENELKTTFYSNLKISDISSLYTFSDIELIKVSAWDFKYGDNILISKDYE